MEHTNPIVGIKDGGMAAQLAIIGARMPHVLERDWTASMLFVQQCHDARATSSQATPVYNGVAELITAFKNTTLGPCEHTVRSLLLLLCSS